MTITERFLNYTKFDTQSAEESQSVPSTAKQLVFANYLKEELEREGLVFPQRTAGRFVTDDMTQIEAIKKELAARHIQQFYAAMTELGYDRGGILALLTEEKEGISDADSGM